MATLDPIEETNEDGDLHEERVSSQLIALTTSDVASGTIKTDLLSAEQRGKSLEQKFVAERLVSRNVPFF